MEISKASVSSGVLFIQSRRHKYSYVSPMTRAPRANYCYHHSLKFITEKQILFISIQKYIKRQQSNRILYFTLLHNSVHDSDTQDGETALMKAACNGHVAIAEMLIEAGADIHVQGQVTVHCSGYNDCYTIAETISRTVSRTVSM
jgi:ankyrin repeat protein